MTHLARLLSLLFLFSSLLVSAQQYETEWQEVLKLEKDGLTRSALEKVESIYGLAQEDNNGPQQIKALLRILNYNQSIAEQSDSLNLVRLEEALREAKPGVKQILHTVLANQYLNYYSRNRYRILNRTQNTVQADNFQTWDVRTLQAEIARQFVLSLQDANYLQSVFVRDYQALLDTAENSPRYRPTLYDLLAHKALSYYQQPEYGLTQAQGSFVPGEELFVPAAQFRALPLETGDTLAHHYRALQLYQDLLAFHRNDPLPLVDLELKRLEYLRTQIKGNNADTLYLRQLEVLSQQYPQEEITAEAHHAIALLYSQRAGKYDPFQQPEYQADYRKAWQICASTIKRYPKSSGAKMCQGLQARIEMPALETKMEKVQVTGQDFRLMLKHKNLQELYVRIYDGEFLNEQRLNDAQEWQQLSSQTPIRAWTQMLPQENDYQFHRLEIPVEGLANGRYLMAFSSDPSFDRDRFVTSLLDFQCSDIAFYSRSDSEQFLLQMGDRQTGKPLKNVQVKARKWEWRQDAYVPIDGSWTSNKEGWVSIPNQTLNGRFDLELTDKKDKLLVTDLYSYYSRPYPDMARTQARFFLDRKIYRPGQTVYYKALLLQQKGKQHSIVPKRKTEVILRDVNGQVVETQSKTSNEFGTISGSFTAPASGLTGNMRLVCEGSSESFRVEEYKRPRFEVLLDDPEGEYKLGDQIQITGSAKAYSGVQMDGAKVRYRVQRTVRYPYWRWWWRPMPSTPAQEIVNGEVQTNEKGEFTFSFEAIPGPSVDPEQKPVFTYEVNVDVSDITGETHSANSRVKAGYVGLEMQFTVPSNLNDQNNAAKLWVTNLNGQAVATPVKLQLEKLQVPERILRSRQWERPDQYAISETEYRKRFPHDVYEDENQRENWRGQVLSETTVETEKEPLKWEVLFNQDPSGSGQYRLIASMLDPSGDSVEVIRYFSYQNPSAKKLAWQEILTAETDRNETQPGQTVQLTLRTSLKKAWVRVMVAYEKTQIRDELVLVKGKKPTTIQIPITEEHRGGIHWSAVSLALNEPQKLSGSIAVPWSNKELQLSWSTFRSKLQPGQEEEWKLTIKGPKGEAVAAELVASMYDASLDAFAANQYSLSLYPQNRAAMNWDIYRAFGNLHKYGTRDAALAEKQNEYRVSPRGYDNLPLYLGYGYAFANGAVMMKSEARPAPARAMDSMDREMAFAPASTAAAPEAAGEGGLFYEEDADGVPDQYDKEPESPAAPAIRKNLQETAFFFPDLQTDEAGNISLSFTIPEALTRWKFLGLAHTKDLQIGTLGGETVTQKELMVLPSLPRFLREGDKIRLISKLSNLSETSLNGSAQIRILDARTMQPVNELLGIRQANLPFVLDQGQNKTISWEVDIPENLQAVVVQISAQSDQFSDGEENILPVLPNRMLVTESLPMVVLGEQERSYQLKGLAEAAESSTLSHHSLTLEMSSNPAWYAVQSLPYLMEFPHECTEQIYSRYYANALAAHVANSSPRIKDIYAQWKLAAQQGDSRSFESLLEQNQELKSALLAETPWVRDAQADSERKQRLGLLFDLNRMAQEQTRARSQLQERQNSNGAFSWFPGMQDSRYITQLIITGFGHLQKLGVTSAEGNPEVNVMVSKALPYLDRKILDDYNWLVRRKVDLKKYRSSNFQVQYLYMRSFFPDMPQTKGTEEAYAYFYGQAEKNWLGYNRYMQGMLSLTFHRSKNQVASNKILASLKENAITHPDKGMYWKDQVQGYYWYNPGIERHALLIEAFYEAGGDLGAVEQLKLWLLRNKRTHNWETTRATVAACNALLATGADWLESQELVAVTVGGEAVDPLGDESGSVEAGTGYFKRNWNGAEIKPEMAAVRLKKSDRGLAWGALYWQYFEQMDKIKFAASPLSVERKLFRVDNTAEGEKLVPIEQFEIGDRVRVQLTLRAGEAMEYVHLKDQRAAVFEPVDVLSTYKWKNGLGFYQSTRDVSTNFFFDYLPQGLHVLEYDLYTTQAGDASQGIATLQSMYAPEFSAHSAGIRVQVKE